MMALLTADWKGLRDQPETLEQGKHSQKVLAETDRLRSRLAGQCQRVRNELTKGVWSTSHMVERSGQPEIQ